MQAKAGGLADRTWRIGAQTLKPKQRHASVVDKLLAMPSKRALLMRRLQIGSSDIRNDARRQHQ